jgi:hypothetical protein
MKLSILLRTTDYRGDHAADACIAYDLNGDETVQQLAERLLGDESYIRKGAKVVEIREIQP